MVSFLITQNQIDILTFIQSRNDILYVFIQKISNFIKLYNLAIYDRIKLNGSIQKMCMKEINNFPGKKKKNKG